MKFTRYLLVLLMLLQQAMAQSWLPLGSNEQTRQSIGNTAAFVTYSALGADGTPYVSYIDDIASPSNQNDFKVHVKTFTGGQWVDLGAATPQFPANDFFPIACDGNQLYLAYAEPVGGDNANYLTVKKYNAAGKQWETLGKAGFSDDISSSHGILAANGKVYVAYSDEGINAKLTVKMYDTANPALGWQQVGARIISQGRLDAFVNAGINMAIDGTDLYVAYLDATINTSNGGGLMVKRFKNGFWSTVGGAVASFNEAGFLPRLAFDNSHNLYLSYLSSPSGVLVVRVCIPPIDRWADFTSLPTTGEIFGGTGLATINEHLYIAYSQQQSNGIAQLFVKKYNPGVNQWQHLGDNPITASPDHIIHTSLRADKDGKLTSIFHTNNSGIFAKTYETGIVMPLKFLQFTARPQGPDALLQWTTESEINTSHFEIEGSTNGQSFYKLGQTPAANSNGVNSYQFTVKKLTHGTHYFRLRQLDKNGGFAYSNTVSMVLGTGGNQASISLYPSVAKETLWLSNTGGLYKHATVTAMDGRKITTIRLSGNNRIDIGHLPQGRYLITCYGATARQTLSFVKE